MRARGDEGFTLIEIVVVVTILGIVGVVLAVGLAQHTKLSLASPEERAEVAQEDVLGATFLADVQSATSIGVGGPTCAVRVDARQVLWMRNDRADPTRLVEYIRSLPRDGQPRTELRRETCTGRPNLCAQPPTTAAPGDADRSTKTIVSWTTAADIEVTTPINDCSNPKTVTIVVPRDGPGGAGDTFTLTASRRTS